MIARKLFVATALTALAALPTIGAADYVRMTFANGGLSTAAKGAVLTILPVQKLEYSVPLQASGEPAHVLVGVAVDRADFFRNAAISKQVWADIAIDGYPTANVGPNSPKMMSLLLSGASISSLRIVTQPGSSLLVEVEFACKSVAINSQAGQKNALLGGQQVQAISISPFLGTYSGTFHAAPGTNSPLGGISVSFTVGADGAIAGTLISDTVPRFGGATLKGTIDAKGNVDATATKAPFGQVHFTGPLTLTGGVLKGVLTATFSLNTSKVIVDFVKQ